MQINRKVTTGIASLCIFLIMTGCQPSEGKSMGTVSQKQIVSPEVTQEQEAIQIQQPQQPRQDAPVIVFENPIKDLGQMGPSATKTFEYTFTNKGTETLKIDRVQSTCGCTVPQLEKKEYAPGESGVIDVAFTAPSTKGEVIKHLYVISNDPETPRYELQIMAEVVVKVTIEPDTVNLYLNKQNGGMPDIVVKCQDQREFSIKSVTVAREVMKVDFNPQEKATEFKLTPVVNLDKLNEYNTGVIQVTTDHPQAGNLFVRYTAIPKYEVTRPRIILQNVEPGVSVVKDVIIRSNYGTPVEIETVSSRNGYMEIESQEKDAEHLQLQIKITPPDQNPSSRRYITDELTLTLKDGVNLIIRCSGWFKLQ